jgi:ABC-type polysaccharide/polyol phosphate transport system ATPase subunit
MSTLTSDTPRRSPRPSGRSPVAVSVQNASKTFRLSHIQYATLKERVLHPSSLHSSTELRALEDVSFDVAAGEFFGVVGRNGSGKSTLLKCLAGIYGLDSGQIAVTGRLSPFIELGVGFNLELTARDNVLINGIMLGLSRREARARFDEIVAFAELEEYVDMKLKNYSSGMLVRLAFSVAIRVDADVLLIDEVLAVGDAAFQQKCFDSFARLRREGRAIMLVTHDMGTVERVCDRAMLLERGRMLEIGDAETVTRRYNEVNFARLIVPSEGDADGSHVGDVAVLDLWFEDETGTRIASRASEQPVIACMRVAFRETIEDPHFSMVLRNDLHHPILAATSHRVLGKSGRFSEGQTVLVKVKFDNWLAPGQYRLTAAVLADGGAVLDHRPNAATLLVHSTYPSGALVEMPYELEIVRD